MEEKFNNYMVVDIKGNQHFMVVSQASNQGLIPPSKEDPLVGTIEETDEFKAFLERYNRNDLGVLGTVLNEDGAITTDLMLREIDQKFERKKRKCGLLYHLIYYYYYCFLFPMFWYF